MDYSSVGVHVLYGIIVRMYFCFLCNYLRDTVPVGGGRGGGVFTIEKKTMLNMVKLCVIPEKKTILPPPEFPFQKGLL